MFVLEKQLNVQLAFMLGHSISPQKTIWGHMAPGSFLFSNYRKVIYVVNPIDDYDNH